MFAHRLPQCLPARHLRFQQAFHVLRKCGKADRPLMRRQDHVIGVELVKGAGRVEDLLCVGIEGRLIEVQVNASPKRGEWS